jgi:uncharacterized protein
LAKSRNKARGQSKPKQAGTAFEKAWSEMRSPSAPPPTVSGRWLLGALAVAFGAAALCCWGALCLLFWQGSWQLLYHPSAAVTRTPASVGVQFESVGFAVDETGKNRLTGWWIPADQRAKLSSITVLYLHDRNGNLGDTVDVLAMLHQVGVNALAFDYRAYGQSQFARPSEAHWREDAEWALQYLSSTRQIPASAIVVAGEGLGADLALEIAAAHPELRGVIAREPVLDPANIIFGDARAKLVPARLLVRDRYDLNAAAAVLRIPSLWFYREAADGASRSGSEPQAFQRVGARKMLVWLGGAKAQSEFSDAVSRWLADLPGR